ncbi:helix-hairpin-helix domain-containing protein [Oceanobacillus sp. CFH 90083]|uniref:helix-hairpin-helix domain-containing protein n=1 Tax=Oceanobacillus sp. CFH 90083 TaxID=2592336 RepID=UPI00128BDAEC|nr:helix-hairpin-helix domain-containing protein [Oceanobacillus sp. CFH 90083]
MYWLKKNIPIFIIIAAVIVLFIFVNKQETSSPLSASLISSDLDEPINDPPLVEEALEKQNQTAMVDLKGEVVRPGVYEMEEGDRIRDVIERADGFTDNADILQVNLAQIVQDEMVILIPAVGQAEGAAGSSPAGEQAGDGKIKINTASMEELTQLPGIGPAKAEAIITHRDNHGLFQKAEDLLEISGIGEKTLETLVEHIQVP